MESQYYVVSTPGYNSRLDEVQAEILRRKLTRLDDYLARRRAIAARYEEAFDGTDLVTAEDRTGQRPRVLRLRGAPPPSRPDHRDAQVARHLAEHQLPVAGAHPVGLRPSRVREGFTAGDRGGWPTRSSRCRCTPRSPRPTRTGSSTRCTTSWRRSDDHDVTGGFAPGDQRPAIRGRRRRAHVDGGVPRLVGRAAPGRALRRGADPVRRPGRLVLRAGHRQPRPQQRTVLHRRGPAGARRRGRDDLVTSRSSTSRRSASSASSSRSSTACCTA